MESVGNRNGVMRVGFLRVGSGCKVFFAGRVGLEIKDRLSGRVLFFSSCGFRVGLGPDYKPAGRLRATNFGPCSSLVRKLHNLVYCRNLDVRNG